MVIKSTIDKIESFIKYKNSFILCTYYIDYFSSFYTAKLDKELKRNQIDIYYLEVEDFLKICNLNKRIFPIFCFFISGELVFKTCGFIEYDDLFNKFAEKIVLFS